MLNDEGILPAESIDLDIDLDSTVDVATRLEDLALDFLSQLYRSGMELSPESSSEESSSESDGDKNRQPSSNACIRLKMVDRAKTDSTSGSYGTRYLTYPRRSSKGSARSFAQVFRVINLMHEAIIEDIPITKRDIYYRDVSLFKSQKTVDIIVDDIAATLEVERSDLNVRATSKGIFCGSSLTISLTTGEEVHGNDSEPTLIPVGEDIQQFRVDGDLAWVIVVEKDAVFQTLCHLNVTDHPSLPGQGLIITGKGYPDMATRHLVKTLADCLPRTMPIVALVDGDPFGLDILSVYKYGSNRLRHESGKLAAGRLKWMGLWSSELSALGIDRDALIPISQHDEKKALSMLQRPREIMPSKWRKELMHMLHNRRKAEIEILSTCKPEFFNSSSQSIESQSSYTSSDDQPLHRSPLFEYLRLKLPQFIASAQARFGNG